ncbi:site-specific integrase [Cytobacillus kochii]|uniref:site-specific integrase n=1 Tax=Cytobacillus kochii TaxID=859143 RepID=UPI001CD35448|nr:tyrosine-type recombinase/integrase [Cytobacillus kochii]MCA1027312.1 site-specific integrase [Cytobacillus kochii]
MPIYEYQKKGETYYYYAFEVKDSNGKRKTIKKRGFKGKKVARDAESQARLEWQNGRYVEPNQLLFGEFITTWLKNKQNISEGTRHTNDGHLRNHIIPEIGHIPLQKVKAEHIEGLISALYKKGLAEGTVRKIYNLVQTCFKSAEKKEYIGKNPFNILDDGAKPKVSKKKMDYWTKEEVKFFLNRVDNRFRIMYVLAIYTGMRRGEIIGLTWKNIDFDSKTIRVSQTLKHIEGFKGEVKTASGYRTVSISDSLIIELKKHRAMILKEKLACSDYEDFDLVVCHKDGRPINTGNFTRNWQRILEKTDARPIRFHDLRHTCASLLFSAGVHPKVVQEQLGHASIKITLDTYSHMQPNMQAEAAKALDQLLK